MNVEFGSRKSEFGIPALLPLIDAGGWGQFRIPNSEFRIGWVEGRGGHR
jgi:hypothetical protein